MRIKLLLFVFLMALLPGWVLADGRHYIDSLNVEMSRTKSDTMRIIYLAAIAGSMADNDSAIDLFNRAIEQSEKVGYKRGEMLANDGLGYYYMLYRTELDKAFSYFSQSRFLANELKDTLYIAETERNLAHIFQTNGDLKKAELTYTHGEEILQNNSHTLSNPPVRVYIGCLANTYAGHASLLLQQDSLARAAEVEEKAEKIFRKYGWNANLANSLCVLGDVRDKQNDHKGAIALYNESIGICELTNNRNGLAYGLSHLALQYSAIGNYKLAQQKADSALLLSRTFNFPEETLEAYYALAAIHKQGKDYKKALENTDSAIVLKEKIISQESATKIAATEQRYQRQLERIKLEKEIADVERANNIQMAGIVVFLITFIIFVIALSRRKTMVGAAKYLGIIALLFLFEFIYLILHPLIEKYTHHSPVYMLIILVVVAAVLAPLHHRIEAWVKKQLTTPPNLP